ncbi:MAG: glycosyltransferase family 4 protein [Candidatus Helarchaeota archaeon]
MNIMYAIRYATHPHLDTIKLLNDRGNRIVLFVQDGYDVKYVNKNFKNRDIIIVKFDNFIPIFFLRFLKLVIKQKVDIIDVNLFDKISYIMPFINIITGIPYIMTLRGTKTRNYPNVSIIKRVLLRLILIRASFVVCVEDTLTNVALRILNKKNWPKIREINNHVLISNNKIQDRNLLQQIKDKYGIKTSKVIIFNHRIIEFKRPMFMIKSFKEVLKENDDITLLFFGNLTRRPLLRKLIQFAKDNNMLDNVKFLKWMDHEDLEKIYSISDIEINICDIVYATNATLEALNFGMALIVLNTKNSHKLVINGKNGFIVNLDINEIKEAILKIINNDKLLRRMKKESENLARLKYDLNYKVNKLIKLYKAAINNK